MTDILVIDGTDIVVDTQTTLEIIDVSTPTEIIETQAQGPVGPQGPIGLPGVSGDVAAAYTNATPTPSTLGGVAAGTTFLARTVNSVLDELLYPYQAPAFSSFACVGTATTLEVGDTVLGARTFTWGTTNPANITAGSLTLTLFDGAQVTGLSDDGSEATASTAQTLLTAGTVSATIAATNSKGGAFSRSTSVQWLWRKFFGSSADAALLDAAPLSSALSASAGASYPFAAAPGTYKYILYPASFAALSSFKDLSTNLGIPFSAAYTTDITNAFGVTATYRVHRSLNQLGGAITIVAA